MKLKTSTILLVTQFLTKGKTFTIDYYSCDNKSGLAPYSAQTVSKPDLETKVGIVKYQLLQKETAEKQLGIDVKKLSQSSFSSLESGAI